MIQVISFEVEDEPRPQPRIRCGAIKIGKGANCQCRGTAYPDNSVKIKAAKEAIANAWRALGLDREAVCPSGTVVLMSADYIFSRRAGKDQFELAPAEQPEGRYFNPIKKDTDNITKLVKDALSQVAYNDDSFVCGEIGIKEWSHSFLGGKSGRKRCSGPSRYIIRLAYLTGDDRFSPPSEAVAKFMQAYEQLEAGRE